MSKVADSSARSAPARTDFRAALAARQQRERIDDDGFARAGFAGEHRESGAHFQLDEIDDGEVANLQVGQHVSLGLVEAAAAPMELGAQQPVVLELVADAAA